MRACAFPIVCIYRACAFACVSVMLFVCMSRDVEQAQPPLRLIHSNNMLRNLVEPFKVFWIARKAGYLVLVFYLLHEG